ncbi:serine/threonine-protein phosphatase 6 regulatory ankyrin repeat subunit C-like isoform X2 [Portunus trituberculatus]|nr:serine/threonine-protein phosphatase 6 regulatory ankyrin repeat subunit C-like isoform X2 [Portunus trituberculatus]
MVQVQLENGANPLAERYGKTALSYAAGMGNQECVKVLLQVTPPNSVTESPVLHASRGGHKEVMKMLVEAGWSLNCSDSAGFTSLHYAVMGGNVEVTEYLLQQGVSPLQENLEGLLPLDVATNLKQHGVKTLLTKKGYQNGPTRKLTLAVWEGDEARVEAAICDGGNPLVEVISEGNKPGCLVAMAAFRGHYHLLPRLLEAGLSPEGKEKFPITPLSLAAAVGHLKMVYTLIILGADPLATGSEGNTALDIAAMCGQLQCVAALLPKVPTNFVSWTGITPVHGASLHGHKMIVEILEYAGWDLNVKDLNGHTPLHWAVKGGHVEVTKYLMGKGLDPLQEDREGNTAMDIAMIFGCHAVEAFLKKKRIKIVSDESKRLFHVKIERSHQKQDHLNTVSWMVDGNKAIMNNIPNNHEGHAMNEAGLTPLHEAAKLGVFPEMIEKALQRGMNPHVITPENITPADLARDNGHNEVLETLQEHQCEQDNSSPEQLYESLLSTISIGDDVQLVSRLICKGTPTEPLGSQSLSALQLAVTTNRVRIVNLLLAKGAMLSAGLLQVAWQNPDTSTRILAALINAYCCRLLAERRRLEHTGRALVEGIDHLLNMIKGDTPWEADWPNNSSHAALSRLLTEASRANCPVTAAFLHKAGAWAFFTGDEKHPHTKVTTALHAALEANHYSMAEVLIRDLRACPYVPDGKGRLPCNLMTMEQRQKVHQMLFDKERSRLQDLEFRQKDTHEKLATREALSVQEVLFQCYIHGRREDISRRLIAIRPLGRTSLLLAARKGLLQLTYLLLRVGRLPVDAVLDDICCTTALHEAASHGQECCVELLLCVGADLLRCDAYGQTPHLLASMFGYTSTYYLLMQHHLQDLPCRAGTTAAEVKNNFDTYLHMYEKCGHVSLSPIDRHDSERVMRKILKSISLVQLQSETQKLIVDFTRGEALEVREVVMTELEAIMAKVSEADPTYSGKLKMVGSSHDGSKLYAPDEFDVNIVIRKDNVRINVSKRKEKDAHLKGTKEISVDADQPQLQGNKLMNNLYEEVQMCLTDHLLKDARLSFVPPGLTSTQVGVAFTLAWQGKEYPLLLVGVDLVPVLEVPWQEEIARPRLTPDSTKTIQLSNAADGSWRCSFAETEAELLKQLKPVERLPQLMGKFLLSSLKAEPWMPQHKKTFCTWFAARDWNIVVPSGFCFKNAFLFWLQDSRTDQEEGNPGKNLVAVLKKMCAITPADPKEVFWSRKIYAYFGGECEGPKPGNGAPLIVRCLEENLNDSCLDALS